MKELFWRIFNANSEDELTTIINSKAIFKDRNNWKPYGGIEGNFGTFEAQQNNAIPALVEKITNSIDATLIKECRISGIDPKSKEAPKTMIEAVEKFYQVPNGEISELGPVKRRELAENIQIIASGDQKTPSILIYDAGEGQVPKEFENTFLSLHRGNKANIHFVQGKYNMGSTGAVVFCGEKKYQLIGSKRDSNLCNGNANEFGFTLVRRHPLDNYDIDNNVTTTWYEYFCPDQNIASFSIDTLDLGLLNRNFQFGTIVKMYSYQLPTGSKGDISTDLYRDLNQYLYHLPIPITVYEKREHYKVKNVNKVVVGNRTRIVNNAKENVEKNIRFDLNSSLGNFSIPIDVIIFNSNVDHREFIKNKSIIYTQNGQVHGFGGQSFISQDLGFPLIKKHTLVHVDCTNIPTEIRQDLFMSNRTHLREGPKTETLKSEIVSLLKSSTELRKLNNERKDSLLRDSKTDKDLLETFLSNLPVDKDVVNLLKKNGSLDFLKLSGSKVNGKQQSKKDVQRKLDRFPSIFKLNLKEQKNGKIYKTIPLNSNGNITIETDVEDDYLFRPVEKGKFEIQVLQKKKKTDIPVNPVLNLFPNDVTDILTINKEGPTDGTIKLLIKPNEQAQIGDEVEIKAKLSAPGQDFECIFNVKVDEKISKPKTKEKKATETFPNLPTPKKAYKKPTDENSLSWDNDNLKWNGHDIVKVIRSEDNNEMVVEGIIINMDSYVLLNFISKNSIKTEKEIKFIKDKYFLSIYLHSLFLFSIMQKMQKDDKKLNEIEMEDFVSNLIKPYANFLLYENYQMEKHAFVE
ncbi:hypothetical protein [Changchengzhania lutea]|uniref:hypothetical protein n=1 Tax=Changchengzhania lutea TaxID=2049305 RepID=UPI00115D1CB8|nr:hypothetical protein [Changchengzhania lutea]